MYSLSWKRLGQSTWLNTCRNHQGRLTGFSLTPKRSESGPMPLTVHIFCPREYRPRFVVVFNILHVYDYGRIDTALSKELEPEHATGMGIN